MRPWMRTALAVVLVLAIAAGGFFLPNLVAARLDRADQDTAFSLSTGDEQGPATVLRRKLTDGMQNLFYGAEKRVELDESAAAHTLAEITQYAQDLLGALEKDSALFGGDFSVEKGAAVDGQFYHFFGLIFSNHYFIENPTRTRRDYKRILQLKQVLEFIEKNYANPITLQELSASVSMSPKYFCRFFSEMTHQTPVDYLNRQRIEEACIYSNDRFSC